MRDDVADDEEEKYKWCRQNQPKFQAIKWTFYILFVGSQNESTAFHSYIVRRLYSRCTYVYMTTSQKHTHYIYYIEMRKLSTFTFLGSWFLVGLRFWFPSCVLRPGLCFQQLRSLCVCTLSIFIFRFSSYVFHFSFASQFEWKIDICLLCCCRCRRSTLSLPIPPACCCQSFSLVLQSASCRKSSVIRLVRCWHFSYWDKRYSGLDWDRSLPAE